MRYWHLIDACAPSFRVQHALNVSVYFPLFKLMSVCQNDQLKTFALLNVDLSNCPWNYSENFVVFVENKSCQDENAGWSVLQFQGCFHSSAVQISSNQNIFSTVIEYWHLMRNKMFRVYKRTSSHQAEQK